MKTKLSVLTILLFGVIILCGSKPADTEKERMVLIKTDFGDMKVKLYNETPLHRDNFLKLAGEGYYNGLLFHRVIKGFMIQGGDPDSRNAGPSKHLGGGGPDYQIPAEINDSLFHKKGVLAAARSGDNVNPERKSSGSQFYIVQGKVFTPEELQKFEDKQKFTAVRNEMMKLFKARQSEILRLQKEGKVDSIEQIKASIAEQAEKNIDASKFQLNEKKRQAYTTIGGTPFLDGDYTVFGEIVEGLNVIDSIANVQIGEADRPVKDVKMTIEIIE
jgi:cyclophilin family peptidyl-prolyl cis-trans isomerase